MPSKRRPGLQTEFGSAFEYEKIEWAERVDVEEYTRLIDELPAR